jgi:phage I-like protein
MTNEQTLTLIMGLSPGAPDEFVIFPLGQVTGTDMEPFTVDYGSIESVKAAHQAKGTDTVIDYEHQTLTGQVAPAAGWVKDFFLNSSGLACRVDWTDRAKEYIKNREYRYFSPVVGLDKERNLVSIQSIALTNLPKGHDLTPLAMKGIEAHMETIPQISETDREVMKQMGISEADFLKYSPPADVTAMKQQVVGQQGITETDREVMARMGISESDFIRYSTPR